MKTATRDYNLDFFKGLASISIVFIHTAFYSGGDLYTRNYEDDMPPG